MNTLLNRPMTRQQSGVLAAMLLACCFLPNAHAHKFKCFATAEGRSISGYAWLGGGGRPQNVPVKVTAPDGTVLAETRTNENGEFSFTPKRRCDHLVTLTSGDGHQAHFLVEAAELPADLPPLAAGTVDTPEHFTAELPEPGGAAENTGARASRPADIAEVVSEAVSRQIAPLRRELHELTERQRLQDILGGVGYLMGVAGIAFCFLGAQRTARKDRATD